MAFFCELSELSSHFALKHKGSAHCNDGFWKFQQDAHCEAGAVLMHAFPDKINLLDETAEILGNRLLKSQLTPDTQWLCDGGQD